jgi:hypothetical protein
MGLRARNDCKRLFICWFGQYPVPADDETFKAALELRMPLEEAIIVFFEIVVVIIFYLFELGYWHFH